MQIFSQTWNKIYRSLNLQHIFQGVRKEVAIKGNWYWQRIRICKDENNRHFYELVI